MHQIMNPFPYAEWDCDEVLENLPFKVDAILLGDYHGESERVLREAKAFEKKLAENASEIESLNGKIRTSLALIENYGQRLGELNEKIKGLAERETQEKEKLKTLGAELETLRKKEALAKETHVVLLIIIRLPMLCNIFFHVR